MSKRGEEGARGEDALTEKKQQLLALTGGFCDAHLNADYKRLCKKLIDNLAKRRPAPFLRGRLEIWAAGILHALGSVNFLFDKSFPPHVSAPEIADYFQVAPGSASQKAAGIRELFKLSPLNTEYMTKQMQERMAPTFDSLMQLDALMSGRRIASNAAGDTVEDGRFIARESAAQSPFYGLAERYQKQGPTPAIEQALRKLIAQDPDFYDTYLMLRDVLQKQGRAEEGELLLEEAYRRALARITDARGNWPPALEWGWLENRHLIRTLLNKALAEWTAGRTDAALELLRRLLRSNPGDNIGARDYILAIRMGMTFEEFERTFLSQFGYDALKMMDWFDKNIRRFPEEFDWWRRAVDYDAS